MLRYVLSLSIPLVIATWVSAPVARPPEVETCYNGVTVTHLYPGTEFVAFPPYARIQNVGSTNIAVYNETRTYVMTLSSGQIYTEMNTASENFYAQSQGSPGLVNHCVGAAAPTATPTVTRTPTRTSTPVATNTPTVVLVTATPVPPSPTPDVRLSDLRDIQIEQYKLFAFLGVVGVGVLSLLFLRVRQ